MSARHNNNFSLNLPLNPVITGCKVVIAFLLFFITLHIHADPDFLERSAKNIRFKRIMDSNEGDFTFARINAIAQDHQGFMWFGSDYGIARYDGVNTLSYKHNSDNPRSLSENVIFAMTVDHDNYLWIATNKGLNRFNRFTDDFDHFLFDPNNTQSISNNNVMDVLEGIDHRIYLATLNGLNIISQDRKTITRVSHNPDTPNTLISNQLHVLFKDSSHFIWIGTKNDGLQRYDPRTENFLTFTHEPTNDHSLSHNFVRSITQDKFGRIWVATEKGLNRLNDDGKTFTRYSFLNYPESIASLDIVFSVRSDSRGNLWITLNQVGIALYDFNKDRFTFIPHDPSDVSSPIQGTVLISFEDRQGDLWFANFPTGINYFNRASMAFKNYYHSTTDENSLSNSVVSAVHKDKEGNIWVGTENGLNLLEPSTGKFKHFMHDKKNNKSLPANAVLSIAEDHQQQLLVGTWGGGLTAYNKKEKTFKHFPLENKDRLGPSGAHVWALDQGDDGRVWVGTQTAGFNLYDTPTGKFEQYIFSKKNSDKEIIGNFVFDVYEDSHEFLWGGGELGLFLFDSVTKKFTRSLGDKKGWDTLGTHRVVGIYEDSRQDIWFTFLSFGVTRYNRKANKFEFLTNDKETPTENAAGIIEDQHGFMWVSTTTGIVKIDPSTFRVIANYGVTNGIANELFMRNAATIDANGRLYFGGVGGLVSFHPDDLSKLTSIAPIALTDFRLFNKKVVIGNPGSPLKSDINETSEIELNHTDSVFTIEFAALNYREVKRNLYVYQLEGFDVDWTIVKDHFAATYTNLNPGRYTFKVRQIFMDKINNDSGRDLVIVIKPPFWFTWWAYTTYAVLALLVYFFILKINFRRTIARERERVLEIASYSDSLTQLKNRRYLMEYLPKDLIQITEKYHDAHLKNSILDNDTKFVFFMIDIDNFKMINDTYGHSAGDKVLQEVAQLIQTVFRQSDYLIRWGGEEFLVVGRFISSTTTLLLAERLRAKVEQNTFKIDTSVTIKVTCSIGFAAYPFDTKQIDAFEWQQVIDIADAGLYAAKLSGRNMWIGLSAGPNFNWRTDSKNMLLNLPELVASDVLHVDTMSISKEYLHWGYSQKLNQKRSPNLTT
jgi:diguanylate cyclase (GGDEF)-like protein